MAIKTYKEHLEDLLKQDIRFVDDEGELMGNKVKSFTDDLDEKLIELLLQDERSRTQFFIKIKDVYVFKASEFKFFLEQNKIDNSFTNYINQIGLSVGGKFLKDNTDVVLDFPYKDCILEGGQSTEEGLDTYFEYDEEVSKTDAKKGYKPQQYNEKQTKRKEIFFNTIVAKDEIDRLLEPKAFTNITKYDAEGESKPTSFTRDADINKKRGLPADTITDNLIIKGNNLLALHTLKEEFKGKVKLIYIDPPYNTGSDSFGYNDNFNHSSWLTFMKNRLDIAKNLLTEDGVIFIQCDHHEIGYLNILCDNIFDASNKVQQITVKVSAPSGFKAVNPGPIDVTEHILFYAKNKSKVNFKKCYVPTGYHKNYNKYFENVGSIKDWKLVPLKDKVLSSNGFSSEKDFKKEFGNSYKIALNQLTSDFAFKNSDKVVSVRDLHKPTKQVAALQKQSKITRDTFFEYVKQDGESTYLINGGALAFYSSKLNEVNGEIKVTELLTNFWKHISWAGIANEGGVKLKNGKKPEKLLKQFFELIVMDGDIVLDYHLGSGTTCATAHKLGLQYIGIEQLNYGANDSVIRLQNVINGDLTGISKFDDVNWNGGGSFIKLDLAKNNQNAKDQILACNNYNELMELFNNLYSNYFLHYNLKIKEFKEVVSKEEKFKALPLVTQKEIFCKMLDNNQLYVNVSEMEDSKHNISTEDIALTKDFYQIKE